MREEVDRFIEQVKIESLGNCTYVVVISLFFRLAVRRSVTLFP